MGPCRPGRHAARLSSRGSTPSCAQYCATPKYQELAEGRYVELSADTPQEFAKFLKEDREAAGALVKMAKEPKR